MTLTELDALTTAMLPVRDLADHLRLGTGFADDGAEDAVLETYLRSAISAIEIRTGRALLARRFSWTITRWRSAGAQPLPIAPVSAIESVTLKTADGTPTVADISAFVLMPDDARPVLAAKSGQLPAIPECGLAEIAFTAGYGTDWAAVPANLAQAVRLLAASYFEHRSGEGVVGDLPFMVEALLAPYRQLRMGGGTA